MLIQKTSIHLLWTQVCTSEKLVRIRENTWTMWRELAYPPLNMLEIQFITFMNCWIQQKIFMIKRVLLRKKMPPSIQNSQIQSDYPQIKSPSKYLLWSKMRREKTIGLKLCTRKTILLNWMTLTEDSMKKSRDVSLLISLGSTERAILFSLMGLKSLKVYPNKPFLLCILKKMIPKKIALPEIVLRLKTIFRSV